MPTYTYSTVSHGIYLYEALPNTVAGANPLFAGEDSAGKSGNDYHALFKFDLSLLPAGTISAVSLDYYSGFAGSSAGTPPTHDLVRLTQPAWSNSQATWNKYDGVNSWTTPGGDFDTTNVHTWTPDPTLTGLINIASSAALIALVNDAIASRGKILHLLWKETTENNTNKSQIRLDLMPGTLIPLKIHITTDGIYHPWDSMLVSQPEPQRKRARMVGF